MKIGTFSDTFMKISHKLNDKCRNDQNGQKYKDMHNILLKLEVCIKLKWLLKLNACFKSSRFAL